MDIVVSNEIDFALIDQYVGDIELKITNILDILGNPALILTNKRLMRSNQYHADAQLVAGIASEANDIIRIEKLIKSSLTRTSKNFKDLYFKIVGFGTKLETFSNNISPYSIVSNNSKTVYQGLSNIKDKLKKVSEKIQVIKTDELFNVMAALPNKADQMLTETRYEKTKALSRNTVIQVLQNKQLSEFMYAEKKDLDKEIQQLKTSINDYRNNLDSLLKIVSRLYNLVTNNTYNEYSELIETINTEIKSLETALQRNTRTKDSEQILKYIKSIYSN